MSLAPDDGLIITFARKPSRFRRESFNSVSPTAYLWLVKYLWPEVGVCFLGGPSGSGKSFWALDAVTRVCRGLPVVGRKAAPAGAVYVGAEDAGGLRLRMVGLRSEIGELEGDRLQLIGQAPDLTSPDDVIDLAGELALAQAEMAARGVRLGLVVIDTMSAATPGADENTAKDMGPVLKALQDLATDLGVLILVVAHTGKNADLGLRGWSGLRANADGLIMLDEADGDHQDRLRCGTVVKVKNGPDGDRFAFTLQRVMICQDSDGDDVTTCIVVDAEAPETVRQGRKPTKASGTGDLIMGAFGRCFDERSTTIVAPGAEGVQGVKLDDLRVMAYRMGVGGGDAEVPSDASEHERTVIKRKWQDQRKADFKRGFEHLLTSKRLRHESGFVWELATKRRAS